MITEYHFPTLIYIKEISNASKLNFHLEKNILQWQKNDPKGVSKTNAGGWHSTTDMNKKQEYNPLSKELFNMQDEIFQKEYLTMKPVLGNMWANINPPGGFNRPPELWREVHYTPRAGIIVMFPAWLWHEVQPNESNDTRISVSFNFLQR